MTDPWEGFATVVEEPPTNDPWAGFAEVVDSPTATIEPPPALGMGDVRQKDQLDYESDVIAQHQQDLDRSAADQASLNRVQERNPIQNTLPYRVGETAFENIGGGGAGMVATGLGAAADVVGMDDTAEYFKGKARQIYGTMARRAGDAALVDATTPGDLPFSGDIRKGLASLAEAGLVIAGTGGVGAGWQAVAPLAGYFGAKQGAETYSETGDATQALTSAVIESGWTMAGGALGGGLGRLAGVSPGVLGRAAGHLATKVKLPAWSGEALSGAAVEAMQEAGTEASHYLAEVGFGRSKWDKAELARRMKAAAGPALVAGGLGGGFAAYVDSTVDALDQRVKSSAKEMPTYAKAVEAVDVMPPEVKAMFEKMEEPPSRRKFAEITGEGKTDATFREVVVEEVKRQAEEQAGEGNWIRVYHGSPNKIEGAPSVENFKSGDARGVYFTGEQDQARRWGATATYPAPESVHVSGYDVRLDNPATFADRQRTVKQLDEQYGKDKWTPQQLTDSLKAQGFDGIIDDSYIGNEYVVFDDKQIRPAPEPFTLDPTPEPPVEPVTLPKRQLRTLDTKVQKLREANDLDSDALDHLDWMLANRPDHLQGVFDEAAARAKTHNEHQAALLDEYNMLFGQTGEVQTYVDKKGVKHTRKVNSSQYWTQQIKKLENATSDYTKMPGFDLKVEQLLSGEQPLLAAEAERRGDGDISAGLFELLQGGVAQFRGKAKPDDFIGDVANEALAAQADKPWMEQYDEVAFSNPIPVVSLDLGGAGRNLARGLDATRTWLKRYFTTAGLANADIQQLSDRRTGRIAKHTTELAQLQHDLDAAVRYQYGKAKTISPELREKMHRALTGEKTDLPAGVLKAIEPMRAQVDALSRELLDAGIGSEQLQLTIDENLGTYLTRTYRKYSDKNWSQMAKADPKIMADAKAALKAEFPEDSDSDIQWRINMLLDKDSLDAKGIPDKFHKDAKFQSILMERKNLPEWIRNLYGENRDPWLNHTISVTKMAQLLAHHEFGQDLREAGLRMGFFSDADQKNPENYRRIDATQNRLLEPFADLYTDPDTATALNDLFGAKMQSGLLRWMTGASMMAKWNVTVGNSKSYLRNFLGNPAFALSNGDITGGDFGLAYRNTLAHLTKGGTNEQRAYIRRLAELNLLDSDIGVAEIKRMMGDIADAGEVPKLSRSTVGRAAARGIAGLSNLYQSMDTFWKINGFESKKKYYRELNPTAPDSQIEELAAADIIAHYPTYSQVPQGVKAVNRMPLMGNFLSFRSEVIRTMGNAIKTANREMRSNNPVEQSMGRKRAVGIMASVLVLPMASIVSRQIFGVSGEDDKDARLFQPPWTRNSPYLYLSPFVEGDSNTIDLGFMDPRAQLIKPIFALLGPGTLEEKVMESLGEVGDPMQEDILFGRVISVLRNKTADGRNIWNPSAGRAEKMRHMRDYLGEVLLPATLSQLDRVSKAFKGEVSPSGRAYEKATELAATIGVRSTATNTGQAFSFRSNDMRRAVRDAEAGIRSSLTRHGTVAPSDTERVLQDFVSQRENYIRQWHELAMAAIRLGMPQTAVRQTVYESAGSRALTEQVMSGVPSNYNPSGETVGNVNESESKQGRERLEIYRRLTQPPSPPRAAN